MPKVPTRDSFSVAAGAGPNTQFNTSAVGATSPGPQQMQQLGQAIQQSSNRLTRIQVDAAREANEIRVNDALNQARQRSIDLTYNTDDGYSMLKGKNALERPEGMSLVEEYNTRLNSDIADLSKGLANDQQRMMFERNVASLRNAFDTDLQRHQLQEFRTYHSGVADAAMKLSQEEAQLYWNNPDRVDMAINGVEDEEGNRVGGIVQAIEQKARLTGMSADEVMLETNNAKSTIHTRVIETALTNKNPVYAEEYFKRNKGSMNGKDILAVQQVINDEVEANTAHAVVQQTAKDYETSFIPNDYERLVTVMQDQGFKGSEDVEFADEFKMKLQSFGTVQQAAAAMSVGDKKVEEAVKQAEADGQPEAWLTYLPKKTQLQIEATYDKFSTGGGAKTMPTKMEYINASVDKLGDNATSSQKEKVRELAEKQYKLLVDARDQKADAALQTAQQLLVENGGSTADLPADVRMELTKYDPSKLKDATDFAKAIREGDQVQTDEEVYLNVQLNRDRLTDMSDAEFQKLLMTKFAPKDRKDIVNLRNEMRQGGSDSLDTLNNNALNEALKGRLYTIGLDPNSKDESDIKKIAPVMRYIRDDLYTLQRNLGHKLSPKDIEDRIDVLFASEVEVRRSLFGKDALYPDTTKAILKLTIDDMSNEEQSRAEAALQRQGIRNPTDEQILNLYRKYRMATRKQ